MPTPADILRRRMNTPETQAQLKAEVADLLARAEAADQADIPGGMSVPGELARREDWLRKLAEARAKIEARARERFVREKFEYEARMAARAAKAAETGKKPSGRVPAGRDAATERADQSDRRGRSDRAGGGWRFRAVLQRTGGGGRG